MLLSRMSPGPKTSVGRTMLWSRPLDASHSSIRCFPRKYGRSSAASADDTETWTIRSTPARLAASNSSDRPRDRLVEGVPVTLEADPVRVVERRHPAQAVDERVVEAERRDVDPRAERMARGHRGATATAPLRRATGAPRRSPRPVYDIAP